MYNVKSELS